MALSRDHRLRESVQEFRIYGGADHTLDSKNDNFFREHGQDTQNKNRKEHCTGYSQTYKMYKEPRLLFMEKISIFQEKYLFKNCP